MPKKKRQKKKIILGSLLSALLMLITGLVISLDKEDENVLGEYVGDYYKVVKVVDGDTLVVERNGREDKVRLIGVDTPELKHPRKEVECFAIEASKKAKDLLLGKRVKLADDPSQYDKDRYGRLLRYVYLPDGIFVNELLIKEGYAYEYTYQTKYAFQEEFKQAEEQAKDGRIGLWGPLCNN